MPIFVGNADEDRVVPIGSKCQRAFKRKVGVTVGVR